MASPPPTRNESPGLQEVLVVQGQWDVAVGSAQVPFCLLP